MGYRYRLDLFLNVQCLDLFCDSYILMTLYCAVSSLRCCLFSALSYHSCGKLLLTRTCFDLHEICFYKNGNDKGSSSLKAIWPWIAKLKCWLQLETFGSKLFQSLHNTWYTLHQLFKCLSLKAFTVSVLYKNMKGEGVTKIITQVFLSDSP